MIDWSKVTCEEIVPEYDPPFVASIIRADAAEPEASFDNIVDAIFWLNQDDAGDAAKPTP